jgi:hypothetical protein
MKGPLHEEQLSPVSLLQEQASMVPERIRRWALDAIDYFADKPIQRGLNEAVLAQKLAVFISEQGFTHAQILRAMKALDESRRFRPTMDDWREQLNREAEADADREYAKRKAARRLQIVSGGLDPAPPTEAPEMPGGEHQLTEAEKEQIRERISGVRAKMGHPLNA